MNNDRPYFHVKIIYLTQNGGKLLGRLIRFDGGRERGGVTR